ncbi:MAG: peptide chain release factor 2 [bacterium]|nr:peptide chain release factor 2 [bacterium]
MGTARGCPSGSQTNDPLHDAWRLGRLAERVVLDRNGGDWSCPTKQTVRIRSRRRGSPAKNSRLSASAPLSFGGIFDLDTKRARIEELEKISEDPELWNNRERAEKVLKEKRSLEREVGFSDDAETLLSETDVLLELAEEEADADSVAEAETNLVQLTQRLDEAELRHMLSGPHDASATIVSINAGAGGTESCDWAEMLLRMYLRWCEERGFKAEILDIAAGEEAGIKSVTLIVEGDYAYGYLRSEIGIHRLVRISPFDAQKRRHTSFASFSMVPDIGDDVEVEIDEKDLRIDTYRAGGAGGQHVNRTDSAVRITHEPSGIVVQCQNERSQHKNKASAMKVLKARLFARARIEHDAQVEKLAGEKKKIDFGSQIRSYTLHPTQRVKDHRTNLEIGNAQGVLDGAIDRLIREYLLSTPEA